MLTKPILKVMIIVICSVLLLTAVSGCIQKSGTNNETSNKGRENGNKIVLNDSLGQRIELSQPASRIVACAHQHVEMLMTFGVADKIVGVDKYTFDNPSIKKSLSPDVKNIDGYWPLNIETTLQLKPDVILTYGSEKPLNLDKIQALNLTIIYVDCYRLEGLNTDAFILGELTGNQETAQRYIEFNQKYQDLIESRLANLTSDETPSVYAESVDYYSLTPKSNAGQIIKALHARNIFEDENVPEGVMINTEWLLQKDPDIIIKMGSPKYGMGSFFSMHNKIANRSGFSTLKAVQSNKIYIYNNDMLSSPRGVIALVYLAKAIYPDRFADIDPDAVRREYAAEFGIGGEEDVEWFYPPFEPVNSTSAGANATEGILRS